MTKKLQVLKFLEERSMVHPSEMVDYLFPTIGATRRYLSYLKQQRLVLNLDRMWYLTNEGYKRLYYLEDKEKI